MGYSSHMAKADDALFAMGLGAVVLEKHITLTGFLSGPDCSVSLCEDEFRRVCDAADRFRAAYRTCWKYVHDQEKPVRAWAYRSLVIVKPLKAGEPITQDHIWSKRPGTGIPAKRMPEYIGRIAKVDIPANTMLKEDMLCG